MNTRVFAECRLKGRVLEAPGSRRRRVRGREITTSGRDARSAPFPTPADPQRDLIVLLGSSTSPATAAERRLEPHLFALLVCLLQLKLGSRAFYTPK